MAYNINNKEFKNYFVNNCKSNVTFIKSLRFNKKSISVTLDKESRNFIFNGFFNEKSLYNLIINYLSLYIKENNLNVFNTVGVVYDKDYLRYVFGDLKINYR